MKHSRRGLEVSWNNEGLRFDSRQDVRCPTPRQGNVCKQDGEPALAGAGSRTISDAVDPEAGRADTLELGRRYGHSLPLACRRLTAPPRSADLTSLAYDIGLRAVLWIADFAPRLREIASFCTAFTAARCAR